jgi:hypothetical protein
VLAARAGGSAAAFDSLARVNGMEHKQHAKAVASAFDAKALSFIRPSPM